MKQCNNDFLFMFKSENLIKVIKFGVYLALLTPLVYIPQTIFAAVFGKMIYFQIIVELIAPFFICLILFYREYRPKFDLLTKLIMLFFSLLFLSSILGVDFSRSFWGHDERMRGLFGLAHFLAFYFYIASAFKKEEDKKRMILFAIIVGILVSVYGIAERINPELSINKISVKAATGHRIISTLGNPIFLAGYMIFVAFLSLYYYFNYYDYTKWLGLGSFLLGGLAIFFTRTRGALLAFAGGAVVWLILLFFFANRRRKMIILFTASSIIVFLLFLIFAGKADILKKNKYWDFGGITDISLNDGSVRGRILLWELALRAARYRPILGWGAENFDYAFDRYYDPQFFRGGINETWSDRAHNWYLDFLVMGGAAGLLSYLAFLAYSAVILAKKQNRNKPSAILAGLLAAFAIFSFFEVDDPSTTLMLFFLFAVISWKTNYPPATSEPARHSPEAKPMADGRSDGGRGELRATNGRGVFVFLCFFIFMLYSVYFYNLRPLYAGIDFINFCHTQNFEEKKELAEKFLSAASPHSDNFRIRFATEAFLDAGAADDKNYVSWALNRAAEETEKTLQSHPLDYSNFHTLGNIYLRSGSILRSGEALDRAIDAYKKALQISPKRQATIFQLSTAYLLKGAPEEAINLLKQAVSYDEQAGQPHWRLAVAYLAAGKKPEAYGEFKNSMNLVFFDTIESEMRQAAALCVQFKDFDCAARVYKVLTEREPNNADIYAQLAAAYAAAGKYNEAKEAVLKAVELDPSLQAEAKIFLKQIGY